MGNKLPVVFMFSGQGSHYYQMGRELFDQEPIFKHWMQVADDLYQDITGISIINKLYYDNHKKTDAFTPTLLTHPAIFMVEHALGQVLLAQGIQSNYVLGTSLGEFAAAVFAGILTFETALNAVIKQAQLIEAHCPLGGMLAILASPELYQSNHFLQEKSELAAQNFHSHFLVSGHPPHLTTLETHLSTQSISFQRLAISHAFHSSLIDAAAADYQFFMNQHSLHKPILPFISCVEAKQLTDLSPSHFWHSVRSPIQFQATIENLERKGNYVYIDLGPSGTLATFVKYNLNRHSSSQLFPVLTPFGQDIKNLTNAIEYITL